MKKILLIFLIFFIGIVYSYSDATKAVVTTTTTIKILTLNEEISLKEKAILDLQKELQILKIKANPDLNKFEILKVVKNGDGYLIMLKSYDVKWVSDTFKIDVTTIKESKIKKIKKKIIKKKKVIKKKKKGKK